MSYDNIAFSGGSNKGYSYIGILRALEKNNDQLLNIKNISGASIGSFFACLYTMDFKAKDLIEFLNIKINITDIDIDNLFTNYGVSSGEDIMSIFKHIISKKYNPDITFGELYKKTNKNLYITASCLTNYKIEYFSHYTHPNMKIIQAIRLSITIPYIFSTVEYDKKIYIDGAIFENLPLKEFNTGKTLGVLLRNKLDMLENIDPSIINDIQTFTLNILVFIRKKMYTEKYENLSIIKIDNDDLNPINFNLNNKEKTKLVINGYEQTSLFFKLNK